MARENGLKLQEMQDAFLALVSRISGFHENHIFWADSTADVPVPPRPYIGMVCLPPEAPLRAADDRQFNGKAYYRLEVLTADSGKAYEFDVIDNTYSHTAGGGDDETDIRDALVAAAAAEPNATVTATGTTTASIDIESSVSGLNLPVVTRPALTDISLTKYRSSRVAQISRPVTVVIELSIWARIPKGTPDPLDIPTADDTSVAIAAKILGGLLHKEATLPMRSLGHIPKLVTSMPDLSQVIRDEAEVISRIDVEVETTLCHTEFGEWTTQMSANNTSPQLP